MRRATLITFLTAVWLGGSAVAVEAQWWEHHHYYYPGYYAGYDTAFLYTLGGGRRYYAQSQRLLGEQIAAQQAAATQRSIRYSMAAETQRRSDQIFVQQQTDRDWWIQTQQQQIADRQQAAALAAIVANTETSPTPPGATDVIKWPLPLQRPEFAEQRTKIEAPYRRDAKRLSIPTAADYQDMLKSVEQMRRIVKRLAAVFTWQQSTDAKTFLDRLATEVHGRLEDMTPKKPPANEKHPKTSAKHATDAK